MSLTTLGGEDAPSLRNAKPSCRRGKLLINKYTLQCCCFVLPFGKEGKLPEPETGWTSRCTPVVRRSLEHHIGNNDFFSSFPPQFRGRAPWVGVQGLPSYSTNLMRRRAARALSRSRSTGRSLRRFGVTA
ncbi:hypothetical protein TNCV_5059551 [Trichonephila clavipes]|nr:hypothetical protein TNCV_5059551 [Trichonephila clavipes]